MTATTGAAQHRAQPARGRVIKALPAVAAVTIAGLVATPANAAPSQPGVTSPQGSQPGVTTTPPPAPVAPAPVEDTYLPGYTPLYDYSGETRTVDDYNAGRQQSSYATAPAVYDSTPAPIRGPSVTADPEIAAPAPELAPVPTVTRTRIVPIETPENTVLVGANPVPFDPAIVDPEFANQLSNTFQAIQADGGNLLVDNGLADAPRADRIAAGTVGGAMTGGLVGLGAGLVPGTAITAGGTAIGAGLGVAATPLLTPAVVAVGPQLFVFVPGAAAAVGAGVGALISAPLVATTTAIGAVTGALLGGAAAGGEAGIIDEPAPTIEAAPTGPSADQLPVIPAPLTTEPAPDLLAQVDAAVQSAAPVVERAVSDANTWVEPVATAVQSFATTVLKQPTAADAATAAGPALEHVGANLAGLLLA